MEENMVNPDRQGPSKAGSQQFTEQLAAGLDADLNAIHPRTDLRKRPQGIRVLGVLAGLWLLIAIPCVTDTGIDALTGAFLLVSGLFLGVVWCHVVLWSLSSIRTRADACWALSVPVAGLVSILLAVSGIGLQVRLALCRPVLERYVATVPPGTNGFLSPSRVVGLFWVDRVQEHQGTVLLFTSAEGLMNSTGLAHIPPGGTMPVGKFRGIRRLSGNWYRFEEKF